MCAASDAPFRLRARASTLAVLFCGRWHLTNPILPSNPACFCWRLDVQSSGTRLLKNVCSKPADEFELAEFSCPQKPGASLVRFYGEQFYDYAEFCLADHPGAGIECFWRRSRRGYRRLAPYGERSQGGSGDECHRGGARSGEGFRTYGNREQPGRVRNFAASAGNL